MSSMLLQVARTHRDLRRYLFHHKFVAAEEEEVQRLFNARETALNNLLNNEEVWSQIEDDQDREHSAYLKEIRTVLERNSQDGT